MQGPKRLTIEPETVNFDVMNHPACSDLMEVRPNPAFCSTAQGQAGPVPAGLENPLDPSSLPHILPIDTHHI